jgi:hypothetical protein
MKRVIAWESPCLMHSFFANGTLFILLIFNKWIVIVNVLQESTEFYEFLYFFIKIRSQFISMLQNVNVNHWEVTERKTKTSKFQKKSTEEEVTSLGEKIEAKVQIEFLNHLTIMSTFPSI